MALHSVVLLGPNRMMSQIGRVTTLLNSTSAGVAPCPAWPLHYTPSSPQPRIGGGLTGLPWSRRKIPGTWVAPESNWA